jgi:basic membrane protein A
MSVRKNIAHVLSFASLLAITTLLIAGCGGASTPNVPDTATQPEPQTVTAAPAKPFRVAVIMPSAVNDLAFSQSMYDSLVRIQNDMGGPEKMEFVYSQGMQVIDDATEALRIYAGKDYDLVIAHGSQYGDSLQKVAPEFPDTSFAWVNASKSSNLPNVFDVGAASQEGGYVNGVLAASLTQSKVIGVIGPVEVGESKRYIDGFKLGVTAINPEIEVKVNYIGSFSDVVKASEVATGYISEGADVMTGTAQMVVGPIGKANENKVLWFGTQSNQSSLAANIVIANQVYHWEVALKELIASIEAGKKGSVSMFTINLANGGEVIEYNPGYALPAEVKVLGDKTVQEIINGTITITLP